eukprot:scaffold518_cov55-Phaeocystis_antarctica.AAC.6
MPPMFSSAELRGGWNDLGPQGEGWEMPIQVDAHFPDLKLQAPPRTTYGGISWNHPYDESTQPQPIDEPLQLRVIVKRRSDQKVAVLLSLATQLRDWRPHPRYGFGRNEDERDAEVACIGMGCIGMQPLRVSPPPSWAVPTGRELVGGCYGLEMEMWWAGPADRGENREENLLRIDGLHRAFYQQGYGPRNEALALADLAAILLKPEYAQGALRWADPLGRLNFEIPATPPGGTRDERKPNLIHLTEQFSPQKTTPSRAELTPAVLVQFAYIIGRTRASTCESLNCDSMVSRSRNPHESCSHLALALLQRSPDGNCTRPCAAWGGCQLIPSPSSAEELKGRVGREQVAEHAVAPVAPAVTDGEEVCRVELDRRSAPSQMSTCRCPYRLMQATIGSLVTVSQASRSAVHAQRHSAPVSVVEPLCRVKCTVRQKRGPILVRGGSRLLEPAERRYLWPGAHKSQLPPQHELARCLQGKQSHKYLPPVGRKAALGRMLNEVGIKHHRLPDT